jgi:mRNA interferase MazF
MPYHVELPDLKLPPPWDKGPNWVKADMIYALSLTRIDLIRRGRDENSRGVYYTVPLPYGDMLAIRKAILCSLGMTSLTKLMT